MSLPNTIFPVFWLISTALKPSSEVFTSPPILFPSHPQFHNFRDAATSSALPDGNFFIYMWNTTWYTALEVFGDTFVGAIVAFGFARLRAPGSTLLFFLVLATLMVPFQATLIPQIVLFKTLGWFDTPLPLIVPTFFGNAFSIFLLRQFFRGIPRELDEAATLDGMGIRAFSCASSCRSRSPRWRPWLSSPSFSTGTISCSR